MSYSLAREKESEPLKSPKSFKITVRNKNYSPFKAKIAEKSIQPSEDKENTYLHQSRFSG